MRFVDLKRTFIFFKPTEEIMRKISSLLFLCLFSALFSVSCSKESLGDEIKSIDHVAKENLSYMYSEMETDILQEINVYRKSKGLNDLESLSEISLEAEDHNYYMLGKGKVSHDNFGERYNALVNSVKARAVSENVAYGYHSADAVVKAWINSEGHRKNIESDYTHFGISVVEDEDGKNYFTNIFVRK